MNRKIVRNFFDSKLSIVLPKTTNKKEKLE